MKQPWQALVGRVQGQLVAIPAGLGGLRRYAENAVALLTSDVFHRATTFLIYALVARSLGAYEFGQLSLALTLFYTFQVVAVAGVRTVITREVAKAPELTARYWVNGSAVALGFSLLSIGALWLFARLMGYQPETERLILLLGVGLTPYALAAVCEGLFQAWERMRLIAYANVPVNLLKIGLAVWLLQQGAGLVPLILLLVCGYFVVLAIAWVNALRTFSWPRAQVDLAFCRRLVATSSTFWGIDVLIALWYSAQTLLLSRFGNEVDVGLYNATVQLTVPVLLVFQSVVNTVFPTMCRRFSTGIGGLRQIANNVLEILYAVAIPAGVGLFVLAEPVLLLFYANAELALAATALRIQVGVIVLRAATAGLGQVLWASQREGTTLRIVATNLLVAGGLGLALIPLLGINGAALAALAAGAVNFFQHSQAVSRLLGPIHYGRLVWKAGVAAGCMALMLLLVGNGPLWGVIPLAVLVYALVYAILLLLTSNRLPLQRQAQGVEPAPQKEV